MLLERDPVPSIKQSQANGNIIACRRAACCKPYRMFEPAETCVNVTCDKLAASVGNYAPYLPCAFVNSDFRTNDKQWLSIHYAGKKRAMFIGQCGVVDIAVVQWFQFDRFERVDVGVFDQGDLFRVGGWW
jgi:hypothetical protein